MKPKQKASVPKNQIKDCGVTEECKPLQGRSFYLHLAHRKNAVDFEKRLKLLGATIEKCFSRDVMFLITDRGCASDYERCTRQSSGKTLASFGVPSPNSNLFHVANSKVTHGCDSSPNTQDAPNHPVTRGQAIAMKANLTKFYGSTDVLESARRWGIKIVHVDKAERWVEREFEKLPTLLEEMQQDGEVKKLGSNYVKFEDTAHRHRPMYENITSFPTISTDCVFGQCIFDTCKNTSFCDAADPDAGAVCLSSTKSSSEVVFNEKPAFSVAGLKCARDPKPLATYSRRVAPLKLGTGTGVRMLASRRLATARNQRVRVRDEDKYGYCEICKMRFNSTRNTHCRSHRHRKSVSEKGMYLSLDGVIADSLTVDTLVSRCEPLRVTPQHRSRHRSRQMSSCVEENTDLMEVTSPKRSSHTAVDDHQTHVSVNGSSENICCIQSDQLAAVLPETRRSNSVCNSPAKADDRPLSPEIPFTPSCQYTPTALRHQKQILNSCEKCVTAENCRISSGYGTSLSKSPVHAVADVCQNAMELFPSPSVDVLEKPTLSPSMDLSDVSSVLSDWYANDDLIADLLQSSSQDRDDIFLGFTPDDENRVMSNMSPASFTSMDVSNDFDMAWLNNFRHDLRLVKKPIPLKSDAIMLPSLCHEGDPAGQALVEQMEEEAAVIESNSEPSPGVLAFLGCTSAVQAVDSSASALCSGSQMQYCGTNVDLEDFTSDLSYYVDVDEGGLVAAPDSLSNIQAPLSPFSVATSQSEPVLVDSISDCLISSTCSTAKVLASSPTSSSSLQVELISQSSPLKAPTSAGTSQSEPVLADSISDCFISDTCSTAKVSETPLSISQVELMPMSSFLKAHNSSQSESVLDDSISDCFISDTCSTAKVSETSLSVSQVELIPLSSFFKTHNSLANSQSEPVLVDSISECLVSNYHNSVKVSTYSSTSSSSSQTETTLLESCSRCCVSSVCTSVKVVISPLREPFNTTVNNECATTHCATERHEPSVDCSDMCRKKVPHGIKLRSDNVESGCGNLMHPIVQLIRCDSSSQH